MQKNQRKEHRLISPCLKAGVLRRFLINKALQGQCFLSRKCVIELARTLKQPMEEYLLLANHLPEDMKNLIEHKGAAVMFRTLGNLDASEMDEVLDVISDVLRDYKSKKRKSP